MTFSVCKNVSNEQPFLFILGQRIIIAERLVSNWLFEMQSLFFSTLCIAKNWFFDFTRSILRPQWQEIDCRFSVLVINFEVSLNQFYFNNFSTWLMKLNIITKYSYIQA